MYTICLQLKWLQYSFIFQNTLWTVNSAIVIIWLMLSVWLWTKSDHIKRLLLFKRISDSMKNTSSCKNNYFSKGPADLFSQNLQLVQFRRNFDPSLMWRCVSNNDDGLGVSVIKINWSLATLLGTKSNNK